jgi:hypothetical protein
VQPHVVVGATGGKEAGEVTHLVMFVNRAVRISVVGILTSAPSALCRLMY